MIPLQLPSLSFCCSFVYRRCTNSTKAYKYDHMPLPQVAELTRLSQTLMLVPNLHWLVAEDAVAPTRQVLAFLDSCSVPHTYLLGRLFGGGPGRGRTGDRGERAGRAENEEKTDKAAVARDKGTLVGTPAT